MITEDLSTVIRSKTGIPIYYTTVAASSWPTGLMHVFADLEERLRSSESNLSTNPSDAEYSGPLFAYSCDKYLDSIDGETTLIAESPINVSWRQRLGKDSDDVEHEMRSNGWRGWSTLVPFSEDRYVIIKTASGRDVKDVDEDIGKYKGGVPTQQRHLRLFDIPDIMDSEFRVCGQAHYDPLDHNQFGNQRERFARSRQDVESDWQGWSYSVSTVDIGNGNWFPSSNGKQGQIDK